MAVIDSSAMIHLLDGTKDGEKIREEFSNELLSTTSISINEVLIGLSAKEKESVKPFIKSLEILPFDDEAAFKSVYLEELLRSKGKVIGKQDIFIASICLVHGLSLITTDKDFQNIPGLKVLMP